MIMKLGQREVVITNFYENINDTPSMTATNSFEVESSTEFPDLSGLENMEVTSCVITSSSNVVIPLQGAYSKVSNVNVSYDDRSKFYTANIVLT